ncbi:MAG: dihydrolipoamide dehydrogenase [Candidatus Latescibacterota bacterium]|jgi:dihydrolipoamide dehydrogenase
MNTEDQNYDIVVIGGGPGGYTAAVRARQLGLKAVVVERETLGGICLNWGCIPTKALLRQAEVWRLIGRANEFGLAVEGATFDWQKIIARSRSTAEKLARGVAYLMKKNEVEVIKGSGRITPTRQVEVRDEQNKIKATIKAEHILIATGSRPRSLPGIEIDGTNIITSREAMALDAAPRSLAIVGAGAIGVEFAYFFNAFGVEVTLVEGLEQILPREDEEVAKALSESLVKQGIRIEVGARIDGVDTNKKGSTLRYAHGGKQHSLSVDKVLMAVGVSGNSEALGLEALGLRVKAGLIEVDGRMQTNIPGIWAIGDVAGPPQLAHMAANEGIAAVEFMAAHQRPPVDRAIVPSCIYCQPQVASVGLSEKEALEQGLDIKVGRFPFAASGKALATGESEGFVKLVFGAKYGELLGGTIVGAEATELIAELALALKLEATYEELLFTIHAHPTLSEAVMEAAGEAFGEAINI